MGVYVPPRWTVGKTYSNKNGVYRYDGKNADGTPKFTKISSGRRDTSNTIVGGAVQDALSDGLGAGLDAIPEVDQDAYVKSGTEALSGLQNGISNAVLGGLGNLSALIPSAPAASLPAPAAVAPPAVAALPPVEGLTSRSVKTIPVDASTGLPQIAAPAPAAPIDTLNSPKYLERLAANGGEAPFEGAIDWQSIGGAVDNALTGLLGDGRMSNADTGPGTYAELADTFGLPQDQPVYDPFGTKDPDKIQVALNSNANDDVYSGQSSTAAEDQGTQATDTGTTIAAPTPLSYPVAPDAETKTPLEITINGGTPGVEDYKPQPVPETAVASELDTNPLPKNSPTYTPGYMPPFIEPPSVKIASGKTVPVGTQGTAQGGRYKYQVQDNGSIRTVNPDGTFGRTTSPPTILGPPAASDDSISAISGKPKEDSASLFSKAFAATPIGHIVQAMTGQEVEGGLLKALGVNKGNTGSTGTSTGTSSANPSATYWDKSLGAWVNQ